MADNSPRPPRTIRVTRAQVYAACARLRLDAQNRQRSAPWVRRLAAVDLSLPGGSQASPTTHAPAIVAAQTSTEETDCG